MIAYLAASAMSWVVFLYYLIKSSMRRRAVAARDAELIAALAKYVQEHPEAEQSDGGYYEAERGLEGEMMRLNDEIVRARQEGGQ